MHIYQIPITCNIYVYTYVCIHFYLLAYHIYCFFPYLIFLISRFFFYFTATFLVNLFQKKNQDFSKVTCTEYVNAAIRADRLDIIIDEFLVFRNRISAWVTDDTFNE